MAGQVYNAGLSDAQIASMISTRNADTFIRVFELLPGFLKDQDKDQVLRGFCEAVQAEIDTLKDSITDIVTIMDPMKVNASYLLEGNLVFFHPEQFMYGCTFANGPASVTMTGPVEGPPASGYYRDFGIYVWSDTDTPSSVGQYRKVLSYDGSTRVGILDQEWSVVPSDNAVIALCWPDRVWLPVDLVSDPRKPGGTILPYQDRDVIADTIGYEEQKVIRLPGLSYLSTIDDYYAGWSFELIDGDLKGFQSRIVGYNAEEKILILDSGLTTPPNQNDWFRLSPPGINKVSNADNGFLNKWLIVQPSDDQISYNGDVKLQARQIVKTEFNPLSTPASHVAWVYDPISGDGKEFDTPPPPPFFYGITNSYVPLTYLASYVGIELDDADDENYQRVQISQAYAYHKLRGTRKALELVCRSFGLNVTIEELASNYTPAGGTSINSSFLIGVPHVQYPNSTIQDTAVTGRAPDDIPQNYVEFPTMLNARIPDSDINIYLNQVNTQEFIPFDKIIPRLLKRLNFYLPAHVQIIVVGVLSKHTTSVDVGETLSKTGSVYLEPYAVDVTQDLGAYLVGEAPIVGSYDLDVTEPLVISSPVRYGVTRSRFAKIGGIPGAPRWSTGTIITTS